MLVKKKQNKFKNFKEYEGVCFKKLTNRAKTNAFLAEFSNFFREFPNFKKVIMEFYLMNRCL